MEECVIDQLKTCITHMLKSQYKYRMDLTICLREIIEQRDNALFFKSKCIADFIAESYVIFDEAYKLLALLKLEGY